jgi:hypothetical protein
MAKSASKVSEDRVVIVSLDYHIDPESPDSCDRGAGTGPRTRVVCRKGSR